MAVSLTYLADHSTRLHFGPLVAPFSFRDPRMLARQALALDDLSGGRMILGVGAGWQEREHTLFGYDLGDIRTRLDRFAEGLEVVTRLLRSDGPVTFEGRFYTLRDAQLLPRPQRPGGPRILIGGSGPKRTLPLVARYADIWNGVYLGPGQFAETSKQLDELVQAAGRQPADVKRSIMMPPPDLSDLDALRRQLDEYAAVGVDELMFQWFALDDIDELRRFAQAALSR
jgi:alkanesulfonate monooxygenase SsuD/methylene tetrahydromethanopterin reductase-like flavin-dependent oxidoreductase (luciferase family)